MPLPPDVTTLTVTGTYTQPDGTPATGFVYFQIPVTITDTAGRVIILHGTIAAQVTDGHMSVTLLATDSPNTNPTGWSYTVTEQMAGGPESRTYDVELPVSAGPTVDLADLVQLGPTQPAYARAPFALLDGDNTFTGANTFDLPVTAAEPLLPAHLATRHYVDTHSGGGGGGSVFSVNGLTGDVVLTAASVGAVATVNGHTGTTITLTAGDVSAVPTSTVTTKGDLIAAAGAGTVVRLAVGTDGQILTADAASPAGVRWSTPASAPVLSVNGRTGAVTLTAGDVAAVPTSTVTAKGDTLAASAAGVVARVAAGTDGQVLTADSTAAAGVRWTTFTAAPVASVNGQTGTVVLAASDVGAVPEAVATTKGDLIAASAPGTVVRLAVGTDGQVLTADSTAAAGVRWTTFTAAPVTSVNGFTGVVTLAAGDVGAVPESVVTAKGDTLAASAAGVVARLAVGTDGQVLTADAASAAGVKWSTPATAPVLSVNGHTGAVTLTAGDVSAVPTSTVTNKGDLLAATGTSTLTRLAAGTDGQLLAADSTAPAGLRWVVPPSAPVTSVNGQTGVVSLTAGDVSAVPESVVTAKGDTLAASAAGVVARLAVGTDGQVLTADAASAAGVKWATPAAAGVSSVNGFTGAVTLTAGDVSAVPTSTVTAKGDTLAASAAGAVVRLAVGTNGQVLTADSTAAAGVKWSTPTPAPVTSVNGFTGVVTLAAGDVGAVATVNGHTGTTVTLTAGDVSAVPTSTVTTKGDLLAASAAGVVARVGVGTDGQVLTADAASAAGVMWSTPTPAPVSSVNGFTGAVTLAAGDVGAVATVNGHTGTTVTLTAADVSAVPASVVTAKGDTLAASAAGVVARLAVGTNGQVLTADSTQTTGVKWSTPTPAPVASVNGFTGAVVLAAGDVGAVATVNGHTGTSVTLSAGDVAAVPESVVTAKGDTLAASAAGVVARLAVGTDGQVLTADAASAAGVKWSTPTPAPVTSVNGFTGVVSLAAGDVGAVPESVATAKGDVLAASGAATIVRLAVGTNGQVLTADSTAAAGVKWATPTAAPVASVNGQTGVVVLAASDVGAVATVNGHSGTTVTLTAGDVSAVPTSTVTTKGDTLAATGAGAVARLAVGTNGQVLTADSTQSTGVKWATPTPAPVTSVNGQTGVVVLAAADVSAVPTSTVTAKGDTLAASAAGVVARLAVGTNGQVLTADSTQTTGVKWATPTAAPVASVNGQTGVVVLAASDVGAVATSVVTTKGDTLAASAAGVVARVAVGTNGQVLTADSTAAAGVKWATPTAAPVTSVNTLTGAVVLTAANVGALAAASNLSDVGSASTARTNLGLGGAAVLSVGTTAGTVAAGDDSRITGAIQASTATTKGDLLAASGAATIVRLAVGTNGQVLTADSTQSAGVKWATPTAAPVSSVNGFTGAVVLAAGDVGAVATSTVTTKGDTLAASAAGVVARLAVGTNGQVLTADSTQTTGVKWATPTTAPVTSVNTLTGAVVLAASDVGAVATSTVTTKGDTLAATGAGAVSRLAVGTNGQVLTADSTQTTGVKWATPTTAPVTSVNGFTGAVVLGASDVSAVPESVVTAKGDLLAATASGAVSRLAVGTNGQILTADSTQSTGVKWASTGNPAYTSIHPAEYGWKEWMYPVEQCATTGASTVSGDLHSMMLVVQNTESISGMHMYIITAGSGMTSGQCFAVLYDHATGNRLAVTADISGTVSGSSTLTNWTFTSSASVTAGQKIYACVLFNGSTPPAFGRNGATSSVTPPNLGLTAAGGLRFSTMGTGLTAAPSSITPSSASTSGTQSFWCALD